jgi:hypothetical protein
MIKQAIEDLGGKASNAQIRDWILQRYPQANRNTISTQINTSTVTAQSRVSMPENSKPRTANARHDILYRTSWGQVELYAPARHGIWEIRKGEDGRLQVGRVGEPPAIDELEPSAEPVVEPISEPREAAEFLFGFERRLRDFLAANIGTLQMAGAPLGLYTDDLGRSGVEYPTGVGLIDILAVDADGNFVIFELKLGRGPDAVVGQIARYMGWVRRNLAGDRGVRGVIVAKAVDEKLRYAASVLPDVSLFEYAMSFTLQPADEVRQA